VFVMAGIYLARFRQGKWQRMRVIEQPAQPAEQESASAEETEVMPQQQPALGVG
jgi:hypothetical protein